MASLPHKVFQVNWKEEDWERRLFGLQPFATAFLVASEFALEHVQLFDEFTILKFGLRSVLVYVRQQLLRGIKHYLEVSRPRVWQKYQGSCLRSYFNDRHCK